MIHDAVQLFYNTPRYPGRCVELAHCAGCMPFWVGLAASRSATSAGGWVLARLQPVTYLVFGRAVAVQFFQYVLPGCDALGYTACTGTNFCVRAQALAKVGLVRRPPGHVHTAVPWTYGISS